MNNELELGAAKRLRPVTLQSATGIGSPVTVEVREDVGVVWLTSYSPLETSRAWANPKLDDLLEALGAVRKASAADTSRRAVIQRLIEKAHAQYHHKYAEWLRAELAESDK